MGTNKLKFRTFPNVQLPVCEESTVFLYKLVLYCEDVKQKKDFARFISRVKEIQYFLRQNSITLIYNQKPEQHCDKNTIRFNGTTSAGWDLLRHLRNAIAHGTLTKSGNSLKMTDEYNGKLTMYGNLETNLLLPLIDVIVSNRKKHK